MILLHGHSNTRYETLRFAPIFWRYGCDLLAYDARNHGESDRDYDTYGARDRGDILAAMDWLSAQQGYAADHIGLFGISYGAASALLAASDARALQTTLAVSSPPAFVIAESPFASLKEIVISRGELQYGPAIRLMMPGAVLMSELRAGFDMDDAAPVRDAHRIQSPVMLIHSLQDGYTPYTHSEQIYTWLPVGRKVLHLTDWGADHTESIEKNPAQYQAWMDEFIAEYAPGFGRLVK